jgi:hypothetical protein
MRPVLVLLLPRLLLGVGEWYEAGEKASSPDMSMSVLVILSPEPGEEAGTDIGEATNDGPLSGGGVLDTDLP